MILERRLKKYTDAPISRQLILEMLDGYKRPNDKISELIKSGELVALRRGLYVPGANSDLPIPEPFLLVNHLRGPSYVSLESALSYWGLILEGVFEISSVTLKSSKVYQTPIGRFSFQQANFPYYSYGITSIRLKEKQVALIATAEKALCDKIVMTAGVNLRSKKQTLAFLMEDLRIEESYLSNLDISKITSWIENAPKKSSLITLVKTLESL